MSWSEQQTNVAALSCEARSMYILTEQEPLLDY